MDVGLYLNGEVRKLVLSDYYNEELCKILKIYIPDEIIKNLPFYNIYKHISDYRETLGKTKHYPTQFITKPIKNHVTTIEKEELKLKIPYNYIYDMALFNKHDTSKKLDEADKEMMQKRILYANSFTTNPYVVLYSWMYYNTTLPNRKYTDTTIIVVDKSSDDALRETLQDSSNDNKKVAWLDMANGDNICGGYAYTLGAQEESMTTNSDVARVLGMFGTREYTEDYYVDNYEDGCHIPPGGNYFGEVTLKSGFFLKKTLAQEDFGKSCFVIAAAFVDLRKSFILEYYALNDPNNSKTYTHAYNPEVYGPLLMERLQYDIEGVLKTAIREDINILILGASGCGVFKHIPEIEAKIWHEMLNKYKGYFESVTFAITPGDNYKAFKSEFERGLGTITKNTLDPNFDPKQFDFGGLKKKSETSNME